METEPLFKNVDRSRLKNQGSHTTGEIREIFWDWGKSRDFIKSSKTREILLISVIFSQVNLIHHKNADRTLFKNSDRARIKNYDRILLKYGYWVRFKTATGYGLTI